MFHCHAAVCCTCRDYLLPSDFWLFFDGDIDTATEAFAYFDRNGDGSISCSELQESAAEMLCERKNIAASIKVSKLYNGEGLLLFWQHQLHVFWSRKWSTV